MKREIEANKIWFGADGNGVPRIKKFVNETRQGLTPSTLWMAEEVGSNEQGKRDLSALFSGQVVFDSPKPPALIQRVLDITTEAGEEDIVLDFFAGSGTTGDAVYAQNAKDAGNRRFILVQLQESTDLPAYPTIAEIAKERIRRAGTKIKSESALTNPGLDNGFRVLKIDTSNMKDVYYAPDAVKQADLLAHLDNIREDRTSEDLLFQVLVDWGVDLALPIATESLAGKTVFFVDGNALAACFDTDINEDLVKELAKRKPLRAVFRDSSYGSDSVKINVEQIFKLLSPSTEIKSL
jgi:adenine-specific DNA-methyltransferase